MLESIHSDSYERMQLGSLSESTSVNRLRDFEACTQFSQSSGSQDGMLLPGSLDKSKAAILAKASKKISLIEGFHNALRETYDANWMVENYTSPHCFLYLVEHLLISVCHSRHYFFTTKYSFVNGLSTCNLMRTQLRL